MTYYNKDNISIYLLYMLSSHVHVRRHGNKIANRGGMSGNREMADAEGERRESSATGNDELGKH